MVDLWKRFQFYEKLWKKFFHAENHFTKGQVCYQMKKSSVIKMIVAAVAVIFTMAAVGRFVVTLGGNAAATALTGDIVKLRVANNQSDTHPISLALAKFKEEVERESGGSIEIEVFNNGVLGSENDTVQQMQAGILAMVRVSASSLENFNNGFSAFNLPYLFESQEEYYRVMDGETGRWFMEQTRPSGFIGLTWFDGGARSFYTKNTKINSPDDLKGLKIRVMDSPTAISMMNHLGASATTMSYGEIYTALQQGVLDGAENNITALTLGKHGEVAKVYSFDEHTMPPDFLAISTKLWDSMTENQRGVLKLAGHNATEYHKVIWKEAVLLAKTESESMGVSFVYPAKRPFMEAVAPMYDALQKSNPVVYEIVERIRAQSK